MPAIDVAPSGMGAIVGRLGKLKHGDVRPQPAVLVGQVAKLARMRRLTGEFGNLSHGQGTTRCALCCETPIRAIVPPLNSRKSLSTPSEKMTPLAGIIDSTTMSSPSSIFPMTSSACEARLTNGSRTAQTSERSSH
jgi:hypothetical protein